jgi:gas vesicle protein
MRNGKSFYVDELPYDFKINHSSKVSIYRRTKKFIFLVKGKSVVTRNYNNFRGGNNMAQNLNSRDIYQDDFYQNDGTRNDLYENGQNSKLLKGIVIGGLVGGALALIDHNTRTKVKSTAVGIKDSSSKMITEVKQNPGDVKDQMISQFKTATNTLKEAITDAQELYQRLNKDVSGNINMIKEISNETFSTAKEARGELNNISSKLKEAGTEITENPVKASSSGQNDSLSNYNTGFPAKNNQGTVSSGSNKSSNY